MTTATATTPPPTSSTDTANPCLAEALWLLRMGYRPVPLAPDSKRPLVAWKTELGLDKRAPTEDELIEWWNRWPDAQVGILTGVYCDNDTPPDVIDLDVDDEGNLPHWPPGDDYELPAEHIVRTPSGGLHIYIRHTGLDAKNWVGELGDRVDLKTTGGIITRPPSDFGKGPYQVVTGDLPDVAEAPEWLYEQLKALCEAKSNSNGQGQSAGGTASAKARAMVPLADGTRDDSLFRQACAWRRAGLQEDEIAMLLARRNRALCQTADGRHVPLPDSDIRRIAKQAAGYEPVGPDIRFTDVGNARRLVALHGDDILYVELWRTFLVWDGRRWARDQTRRVVQFAKDVPAHLYALAAATPDDTMRAKIAEHGRRCESGRAIRDMIELVKDEPGVAVTVTQLDTDRWLLNCLNGTIDLRTGALREHRREDLITKLAPAAYDPTARCDLWDRFLTHALDGDRHLEGFMQRVSGSALSGDLSDDKLYIIHGDGGTGKTTFIEALKGTLGDYAQTANFETFLKKRHPGGPQPGVARLPGARLVSSVEVDRGNHLAIALVKQLTGGDRVATNGKYEKEFEFDPQFTLVLVCNDRPVVPDDDSGFWRRVLELPFIVVIPKEKRDPTVKARLRDPSYAGAGILAWMVAGCIEWQRDGLGVPTIVHATTDEYRKEMDPIPGFLEDCCIVRPGARVLVTRLWESYTDWIAATGERRLKKKDFHERLLARGIARKRSDPTGKWQAHGIGLKTREDDASVSSVETAGDTR